MSIRPLRFFAALAVSALALGGCSELPDANTSHSDTGPAIESAPAAERYDAALEQLEELAVQERTEWDGYFQRDEYFGDGWADLDGDRCNTRQELLAEHLTDVQLNEDGCRVDSGVLDDPYTGELVQFQRGQETSDDVQIDHVVALYNAWRTGAQELTQRERLELANDPVNLQPTVDWANDEKESSDASQWLPPEEAYHCEYITRQVTVKYDYDLWVTPAEYDAMRGILEGCAD